jgi:outer membrane protein OmpA-like peptidoglycan-associated protein
MKANRMALLGLIVCASSAVAAAQMAPDNRGEIGLFTMPSADTARPGEITLGLYGWKEQLVAGNLAGFDNADRTRLFSHWAGEASFGLGLTRNWDAFVSVGAERYENRGGWQGGAINSISFLQDFRADQPRKLRIGTKVRWVSEADPDLRIAGFGAVDIPIGHTTLTVNSADVDVTEVNSRRSDWEWGAVVTKGILSFMGSYTLSGKHDNDIRVSNLLRFGAGVDVPVLPFFHAMAEIDRTIFDGGDLPPDNYSMLLLGGRFFFGRSGWAATAAVNANVDQLFRHGFSPTPVAGLVGITYAAWPPLPPPPVVVPAPATAPAPQIEETKEEAVAVPAPRAPAPPPPAPRMTRDEIYFDAGSARLTNIAKAVLDGIALRMKSDLNSTAVVTGYSDNAGSEESNLAISSKRAEAAKEYLVTRHGIDPNRITTAAKGSAEPAYDNATPEGRGKNRRALIVVTLVSGA